MFHISQILSSIVILVPYALTSHDLGLGPDLVDTGIHMFYFLIFLFQMLCAVFNIKAKLCNTNT